MRKENGEGAALALPLGCKEHPRSRRQRMLQNLLDKQRSAAATVTQKNRFRAGQLRWPGCAQSAQRKPDDRPENEYIHFPAGFLAFFCPETRPACFKFQAQFVCSSYNTALYMRLSRDDENYGDSVSIETQRLVLNTFAREQGFYVVDEYVDDGWSGTNFERPGFQRMLQDIEAGKVNCVLVKDLSRFGREHVMMDYYLEFYFPEKRIRFIAIADNEDTEKGLSDFVPFKNLFNEFWAKDTSRKVKAAIHAEHAAGECTAIKPPFGYVKDPENKNHIIVDEENRWIVEKMFDMAAHGAGTKRIAQALVKEKIPTPGYIAYQRSGLYANIYRDAPPEKAYAWSISVVSGILKDETYIGNSIHNKQGNVSYKNKKSVNRAESDWFRVEGTQECCPKVNTDAPQKARIFGIS